MRKNRLPSLCRRCEFPTIVGALFGLNGFCLFQFLGGFAGAPKFAQSCSEGVVRLDVVRVEVDGFRESRQRVSRDD